MTCNTVPWTWCPRCGKRGFDCEHDALKALGRAQAKRDRLFEHNPSRRGLIRENRVYECPEGLYHLTSQSRREHQATRSSNQN
jgi:hypothetical protein